jgi:amino acid transporter
MQQTPPPALRRSMTGLGGLMLTLTALSPSLGVFVVGSDVLHLVGSGVFLCFLAVVIMDVAVAAIYAELGSAFPHAGGEYTLAGRLLCPEAGFAMLALTGIGGIVAPALCALGLAGYVAPFMPGVPVPVIAMAAVALVTVIAVCSIRFNALFTGALLAIEIAALVCLAWLGFSHAQANWAWIALHPAAPHAGTLHPVGLASLGVAASASVYAFNGFGAAIYFAEEMPAAHRSVAVCVFGALLIGAVAEILPVLGVIVGAPDLAAIAGAAAPIPAFIQAVGGTTLKALLSLGVALAIFNTMIAVVLSVARQGFACARDGCFPSAINHWLGAVHPRFGSPWIGTLLCGGFALLLCLAPLDWLVLILGNGNVAIYACLALAAWRGRRRGLTAHAAYRMRLFPLAPLTVLAASAAITWSGMTGPVDGRVGLAVAVVTMLGGWVYYSFFARRNRGWGFRDPAG